MTERGLLKRLAQLQELPASVATQLSGSPLHRIVLKEDSRNETVMTAAVRLTHCQSECALWPGNVSKLDHDQLHESWLTFAGACKSCLPNNLMQHADVITLCCREFEEQWFLHGVVVLK